jgi:hypothetical protein
MSDISDMSTGADTTAIAATVAPITVAPLVSGG